MKIVYIYCLKHPETKKIRYVGKTTNIKRRLYQHIYNSQSNCFKKTKNANWISSLLKNNLKPIIEIIEECNESNWQEREIYWIAEYKKEYDLCNHTLDDYTHYGEPNLDSTIFNFKEK